MEFDDKAIGEITIKGRACNSADIQIGNWSVKNE